MIAGILKSLGYFFIAALFEVGGVYGVWLWVREGKAFIFALAGFLLLMSYGLVNTHQPSHFGRVYAAYGGVFIIVSILWGWKIDGVLPDIYDLIGAGIIISGVFTIMFGRKIF